MERQQHTDKVSFEWEDIEGSAARRDASGGLPQEPDAGGVATPASSGRDPPPLSTIDKDRAEASDN